MPVTIESLPRQKVSVFDRLGPRIHDNNDKRDRPREKHQDRFQQQQRGLSPPSGRGPSKMRTNEMDPWKARWMAEKELSAARTAVRRREPGAVDRLVRAELALDKILGLDVLSSSSKPRKKEGSLDGDRTPRKRDGAIGMHSVDVNSYASVTAFGGRKYHRSAMNYSDEDDVQFKLKAVAHTKPSETQANVTSSAKNEDPQIIIDELKSRIIALEEERMQAEELANALLASRQEALAEKTKMQTEKDILLRENAALVEQVNFLEMAVASAHGNDDNALSPTNRRKTISLDTNEPPITPDSEMLRALGLSEEESVPVTDGRCQVSADEIVTKLELSPNRT